jgi:two-component system chemotaxis sensor kinase CheA
MDLQALDLVGDGIIVLSRNGLNVIAMNEAFIRCFSREDGPSPFAAFSAIFDLQVAIAKLSATALSTKSEIEVSPAGKRPFPAEVELRIKEISGEQCLVAQIRDFSKVVQKDMMMKNFTKMIDTNNKIQRIEKKKLSHLLDSIPHAVFTVGRDLKIKQPISRSSELIFSDQIVGKGIKEVLLQHMETKDEVAIANTTLEFSFGNDEFQWDITKSNLPSRINLQNPSSLGNTKILRPVYNPIFDDAGEITEMLFVIEDVTHTELMEEDLRRERINAASRIEIINQLIDQDGHDVFEFVENAADLLNDCIAKLQVTMTQDIANLLFRHIHTIKGNARTLGFGKISEAAHVLENSLEEVRQQLISETVLSESRPDLHALIKEVGHELSQYREAAQKLFGNSHNSSHVQVPVQLIVNLNLEIAQLQRDLPQLSLSLLAKTISQLDSVPVARVLDPLKRLAQDVAARNEKSLVFESTSSLESVRKDISIVLRDCLMHLVRNSVDHGIEQPARRMELGKQEAGSIRFELGEANGCIVFSLSDDGHGLDMDRIRKKAVQNKLCTEIEANRLSDAQLQQFIFLPGFSTAEKVTEISGRGFGMDFVRSEVISLGGEILVESKTNMGTMFTITIPLHHQERKLKSA